MVTTTLQIASELLDIIGLRKPIRELISRVAEYHVGRVVPRIVGTLPHDPEAFTQGLLCFGNYLYESTGLLGQSTLRQLKISDGSICRLHRLPAEFFGEGIAFFNGCLYQLTWKSGQALVYDIETFRELTRLPYRGEGWGLAASDNALIISDGSSRLRFVNSNIEPISFMDIRSNGVPLRHLNDIECAEGMIYANVLNSSDILEINSVDGKLRRIIDCSSLVQLERPRNSAYVLNGVAYAKRSGTLFVTGKCWRNIFELHVPP